MNDRKLPKVPIQSREMFTKICHILSDLCQDKLNDEYLDLGISLAAKIARKRPSPLMSGRDKTWAAGIMHAIGYVNYLFDKSQKPYISVGDLNDWFGLSQTTVNSKSKTIRDMFKMNKMNTNWTLRSNMLNHPLVWFVSFGGYLIDMRTAPRDLQEAAYEVGGIPFIPDDI